MSVTRRSRLRGRQKESFLAEQDVAPNLQDYGTTQHTRRWGEGIVGVHQGSDAQKNQ